MGWAHVQWYPNQERIHIAISDFGRGIPNALAAKYSLRDDGEAIVLATEEGITTKSVQGNRGAGLAVLALSKGSAPKAPGPNVQAPEWVGRAGQPRSLPPPTLPPERSDRAMGPEAAHSRSTPSLRRLLGYNDIDPCAQCADCRAHLRDNPPVAGAFELIETGPVVGQVR